MIRKISRISHLIGIPLQIILSLSLYQNLNSKIGTGYVFNNKKIVKKFYSKSFIMPPKDIKEHIYKSKDFFFKDSKTFIVKSFHTKNQAVVYMEDNYIYSPLRNPKLLKTINVKGSFKEPFNMYVDIYPEKYIKLPVWTKAIDFWIKETTYENLKLSFFLKYPTGKETIHKMDIPKLTNKWRKLYFNVYPKKKNIGVQNNILITKIRITKRDNSFPSFFSITLSIPKAYNYIKNDYNLYKEPHKSIEDFKPNSNHFKYSLNNSEYINSPEIKKYKTQNHTNNKTYLSININKHNNKSLFIHFPKNRYKLSFEHDIGLWIKGNEQKEQISILFQEGKKRYFELAIKEIYFKGWKALRASIPKDEISFFKNKYGEKYIYIIGIKITPAYKDKDISISIDNLEAIINPKFLGNIKKL